MSGGAYINIYQLVDKQGNEVMRGTAEELSIKLKCSVVTVTNAGRPGAKDSTHSNFWLRKKYKVIKVGEKPRKRTYGNRIKAKPKVEEDKPLSTKELLILELVKRRKLQTIAMEDPKPYFEMLKQMGVDCVAKEVNDCDVMMRLKPRGRRGKQKPHYFVEVKNRWTTKPSQPI